MAQRSSGQDWRSLLLRALLAGLAVGLGGCDYLEDLPDRFKTCEDVSVELASVQAPFPVHLLGPGEVNQPQNLVAPGATRRIELCLDKGHSEYFSAVRDGQILHIARCPVSRSTYVGVSVRVVWSLYGFQCIGW